MEAYRFKEGKTKTEGKLARTSIFDPVVCELAYRWWCPPNGMVLDPFAGGSVRGIVASMLGLKYFGVELRKEQVVANQAQINENTCGQFSPKWRQGDAFAEVQKLPQRFDFLFSCPPYGNLEKYSDDPADLSNKGYAEFLERYGEIIRLSVSRLKDNSFACFVVANYRDRDNKTGTMTDFVGDTVRAFEAAGVAFYNDVVLVNSVGTCALRTNTSFVRGARKVVKCHQNVLVFIKGDPRKAAAKVPVGDDKNL
jgi:hypothetical protein